MQLATTLYGLLHFVGSKPQISPSGQPTHLNPVMKTRSYQQAGKDELLDCKSEERRFKVHDRCHQCLQYFIHQNHTFLRIRNKPQKGLILAHHLDRKEVLSFKGLHAHFVIQMDTDSYLCIHLCITVCIWVSIYLSVHASIHPSIQPSIFPSILLCIIYLRFYLHVIVSQQLRR